MNPMPFYLDTKLGLPIRREFMEDTDAIIIFMDIRGFTKWAEGIEAFQNITKFINKFYAIIEQHLDDGSTHLKKLGDGAMLVKLVEKDLSEDVVQNMLSDILKRVNNIEVAFDELCMQFLHLYGYRTALRLGWGIVRGVVKCLNDDFIGANINKASRLCSIARPFGIVIERDDFPILPKNVPYSFVPKVRKLEGITDDVNVWTTREIATRFIPREKLRESPEVHVAGLCIRHDHRKNDIFALIAKRNEERKFFPGLYEGCGGQLAYSESFSDGVKRHYKLEMGIDVDVLDSIHKFYEIKEPNEPFIQGIKFLCVYIEGNAESNNHSEVKWVSEQELREIPSTSFIKDLKEEFVAFIERYKKTKRLSTKRKTT